MDSPPDTVPILDTVVQRQPSAGELPLVASAQLFRQRTTLRIAHAGQVYQLRLTRENRLILTK